MYYFHCSCVNWPLSEVKHLSQMIDDNIDITRSTFMSHVSKDDMDYLEQQLCYAKKKSDGLTMKDDWHVSYHRSKLKGERVYYFRHSAIEYVFVER